MKITTFHDNYQNWTKCRNSLGRLSGEFNYTWSEAAEFVFGRNELHKYIRH